jgi:hypothetical protein
MKLRTLIAIAQARAAAEQWAAIARTATEPTARTGTEQDEIRDSAS